MLEAIKNSNSQIYVSLCSHNFQKCSKYNMNVDFVDLTVSVLQ